MLAGRAHLGSGYADVDGHGQAQLGAGGVDRVVELVVERVLLHQRRDPDQRHGRVLRPDHAGGRSGGPVGRRRSTTRATLRRSAWAATVIEQRLGLGRGDPGGDHADVDPALVHGGEQLCRASRRRRGRRPAARGCLRCRLWRMKALAALSLSALTQRSTVGDLPSDVEVMPASIGWLPAIVKARAGPSWLAPPGEAGRPLVSESLISWSLSLEMKRWTRFSNRKRRRGLKAW